MTSLEAVLEQELRRNGESLNLENAIGNFLITSCLFDRENKTISPCFFSKFSQNNNNNNRGLYQAPGANLIPGYEGTKLADIGRATSAAKPFFKEKTINDRHFLDGGFLCNNPAKLGYFFAVQNGMNPQKIFVYSIACTSDEQRPFYIVTNVFMRQFFADVATDLINLNNLEVNDTMQRILNERYVRFSPQPFEEIDLDGISKKEIHELYSAGMNLIQLCDRNNQLYETCWKLVRNYNNRMGANAGYQNRENYNRYISRYLKYPNSYTVVNEITALIENCNCREHTCDRCKGNKKDLNNKLYSFKFLDEQNRRINTEKMETPFYWGLIRDTCVFCKAISVGHLRASNTLKPANFESHLCINNWTPFHFAAANNEINSMIFLLSEMVYNINFQNDFGNVLEYWIQDQVNNQEIDDKIARVLRIFNNFKTSYLSIFPWGSSVKEIAKNKGNEEMIDFFDKLIEKLNRIRRV